MGDCAKQIGFLSRQLLGFRGSAALELQPASLPELVQRAVAMAQRSLTGVEIRTQLSRERSVMCAAPLFVQVLTNLIENGAHAAGCGGWVEVRANLDTDQVVVEVSDSGSGVPLALRERIFEPFFTTKPQGMGTGLGLSVARAIVQRHGGILEVRDRGPRAAFVIELPDSIAE
jgi:signal transduction histidine kinase